MFFYTSTGAIETKYPKKIKSFNQSFKLKKTILSFNLKNVCIVISKWKSKLQYEKNTVNSVAKNTKLADTFEQSHSKL